MPGPWQTAPATSSRNQQKRRGIQCNYRYDRYRAREATPPRRNSTNPDVPEWPNKR